MNALKLSAWSTGIYAFAVLAGGVSGFVLAGSAMSLGLGILAAASLLVAAHWLNRGRLAGGFAAGVVAMILGLFFGYRFIASGNFVPGGIMLLVSFAALFFIILGMFLSLER